MLDTDTGEVLAMANLPSCNPNDEAQRSQLANFRNFAIQDNFEPGSTIKPLIIAAALEAGFAPDTLIDIPPEVRVGNEILTDDRADPNGDSITNILARSSNAGMVTIAKDMDPAFIWQTLKNFGLAGSTGSGLGTSESHGLLDDYGRWGSTKKATLSYGYGLSLTALQLARAYAAIAAGGVLPPVSFVALNEPPERVRIMSAGVAADLTQMLGSVVSGEQATARLAAISNYTVAGKTGTVRIHGPGGYSDRNHRAIFVGFAPASNPRFVAAVIVNDPRGPEYYGGQIAAPVFSRVMETALRLYGVAPDALPGPNLLTSSLVEDRR
jgi:cell division protein FtsI (penicillin-binding protein 3)